MELNKLAAECEYRLSMIRAQCREEQANCSASIRASFARIWQMSCHILIECRIFTYQPFTKLTNSNKKSFCNLYSPAVLDVCWYFLMISTHFAWFVFIFYFYVNVIYFCLNRIFTLLSLFQSAPWLNVLHKAWDMIYLNSNKQMSSATADCNRVSFLLFALLYFDQIVCSLCYFYCCFIYFFLCFRWCPSVEASVRWYSVCFASSALLSNVFFFISDVIVCVWRMVIIMRPCTNCCSCCK